MRLPSLTIPALVPGARSGAATARAVTLRTPLGPVSADQRIRVEVTNFGKRPTAVAVMLTAPDGALGPNTSDSRADGPVAPGTTCIVTYAYDAEGSLTVESKSRTVRAAMIVQGAQLDDFPLVAVAAATK